MIVFVFAFCAVGCLKVVCKKTTSYDKVPGNQGKNGGKLQEKRTWLPGVLMNQLEIHVSLLS